MQMAIGGIMYCSLTVCEGVSTHSGSVEIPHSVPSLYVRVYRRCCSALSRYPCSLTVCEGVSFTS